MSVEFKAATFCEPLGTAPQYKGQTNSSTVSLGAQGYFEPIVFSNPRKKALANRQLWKSIASVVEL